MKNTPNFQLFFPLFLLLLLKCQIYNPTLYFNPSKKIILLTFDDGPNNHKKTTYKVLQVLKKHNVKALFNLIGKNVDKFPAITRQIYNDGHIVANHGYTVFPMLFRRRKSIVWEIDSCTFALKKALQDSLYTPFYFRPSMGWFNKRTLKTVQSRGMKMNGITIYMVDTKKTEKKINQIANEALKKALKYNGGIIVLHDGIASYKWLNYRLKHNWKNYDRSFIPIVTDSIISTLKRNGFSFPQLDDLYPNNLSEEELDFFKDIIW